MATWLPGNGSWGNPANWDAGIPDAPDAVANFPSVPQNGYLISLDGDSFTVGTLSMQSHVLGRDIFIDGTIVMERAVGNALISVGAPGTVPNFMLADVDLWLVSNTTLNSTGTTLNLVMECQIIGAGSLTKSGGGIVEIDNPANNWTGGLSITNGTIRTTGTNVLSSGPVSISASGFLDLADNNQSITSLGGIGAVTLGGATLSLLQQSASLTNIFTGSGLADALAVNLTSATTTFSLAGASFLSWNSATDRIAVLGNGLSNTLTGSGVGDYMNGGGNFDILYGGTGTDSLSGGDGSDLLYGGNDADTLLMDDSAAGINGNDTGYGEAGADLLWGYGGNDTLYGGTENDSLVGNDYAGAIAGTDSLYGGDGADTMFVGLGGNAFMDGGTGNDIFYGGLLADIMRGGTGNDYLYGNAGADKFQFYNFDFANGDSDIIYFVNAGDRLQFNAAMNGNLFFQNLASLEYAPGLFTTGVYITAFLGGGATATITVYGTTVAALTPLVEYTL